MTFRNRAIAIVAVVILLMAMAGAIVRFNRVHSSVRVHRSPPTTAGVELSFKRTSLKPFDPPSRYATVLRVDIHRWPATTGMGYYLLATSASEGSHVYEQAYPTPPTDLDVTAAFQEGSGPGKVNTCIASYLETTGMSYPYKFFTPKLANVNEIQGHHFYIQLSSDEKGTLSAKSLRIVVLFIDESGDSAPLAISSVKTFKVDVAKPR